MFLLQVSFTMRLVYRREGGFGLTRIRNIVPQTALLGMAGNISTQVVMRRMGWRIMLSASIATLVDLVDLVRELIGKGFRCFEGS